MLLALEVSGVIYSKLSKMVSVTQMHRCQSVFIAHSCYIFLQHRLKVTVVFEWKRSCGGNRINSPTYYSPRWNGSADAIPFRYSFQRISISSLSTSEWCLTRISSTSQYFLATNSIGSLPSREGSAIKLVAQLETMLSLEPSVLPFRQLSGLVSTCSLPPGAPSFVRPGLPVVLGSASHQSQKTLQRECRHY